MKLVHGVWIASLAACGYVKPEVLDAPEAPEAEEPVAPERRCDPNKPFGAPERLDLGSSANESGARLTADELTLFFARMDGAGQYDLFQATRTTRDGAFGNVGRLDELATAGQERDPTPSADGSVLYFQRDGDIFVATRSGATYVAAMPVSSITTPGDEITPFVSASGLFYDGDGEIRFAPISATGEVGMATIIAALSAIGEDYNPVVSADELTILWGSRRTETPDGDIWIARRSSPQAQFAELAVLDGVNASGSDGPDWLSPDGCVLYLESNVMGNSSSIFVATRPR